MITRQTIKRLQKEAEGLNPDKDRLLVCLEDSNGFYFNNKIYKTKQELKESEGLKDNQRIIYLEAIIAEKYGIKQTII